MAASAPTTPQTRWHDLTSAEAERVFDAAARHYLNMSGEEFLTRWDAGEFRGDPDRPGVIQLAALLSLGRQEAA